MATVTVQGNRLLVRLTRLEHALGLVGDLDVPLSAIRSAALVASWHEAHGLRVGTSVPGWWRAGSWYSPGRRQLVLLRRGVPALRLELHGQRFHEVVISTPDAVRLSALLIATTGVVAPPRLVLVSHQGDLGPVD